MIEKKKKNLIKDLRRRGISYTKIAELLDISHGTAYRYGKDVEVEEKPEALTPSEVIMKADTRTFMINLIWDVAELTGCGRRKKDKFEYDLKDEDALRFQEYEKLIRETDGFIIPEYINVLRYCFELWKMKLLDLKMRKENLIRAIKLKRMGI